MGDRLSTGIDGLDEVLCGGFVPGRAYLVRGGPGSGKTTLGLHFLLRGLPEGERVLFINQGEPEADVRSNATSVGLDLTGVEFLDLTPSATIFSESKVYDVFHPAEVEMEPTTQLIVDKMRELRPTRVFLDAMTQLRYLSLDQVHFRTQAYSLLRFLIDSGATVAFASDTETPGADEDLQFMSDGIIHMSNVAGDRSVSVSKFRGSGFAGGTHSVRIANDGMHVYPKLVPGDYGVEFVAETISSGVPALDELLCGGIERGTVTVLSGPSGVGKTTLGLQFMKEAAGRGERSVVYAFEEWTETLAYRSEQISIPIRQMRDSGNLELVQVEPLRYTADEFGRMVRHEVEQNHTRVMLVDSVIGFQLGMAGNDPVIHLHALTKYLKNMGVTVLLANETESITGEFRATEKGISYMADNLVFLRFVEIDGELRKVIGVLKKRMSDFEKTMREFEITRYGIKVGDALRSMRGVLSGTPEFIAPDALPSSRR